MVYLQILLVRAVEMLLRKLATVVRPISISIARGDGIGPKSGSRWPSKPPGDVAKRGVCWYGRRWVAL